MMKRTTLALLALLALTACSKGPNQVSQEKLDDAISDAIGDPNTCVLVADSGTGKLIYRFGSHVVCAKTWPACDNVTPRNANELLQTVAKVPTPVAASCASNPDGSRGVSWAAGVIDADPDESFVAVMEGPNTPPGRVIAEKLQAAFKKAGF